MSDDRELCAVLVALEPLDDRKWDYLDLARRTFNADGMLAEPWSSGERVLVEVAASLWDTGRVDLGYVASAMGGRHFQAVVDALAVRAGHGFASTPDIAIRRALGVNGPGRQNRLTAEDRSHG
ncbi:MAG: hypothetical protein M3R09_02975 [Actinomycetota bacterium]|nr:hypothetical protein [Actinomycetota bacterium]